MGIVHREALLFLSIELLEWGTIFRAVRLYRIMRPSKNRNGGAPPPPPPYGNIGCAKSRPLPSVLFYFFVCPLAKESKTKAQARHPQR